MSEEILKALMQLFAIVAKQDEGVEQTQVEYVKNFLEQQLTSEKVSEYFALFEQHAGLAENIPAEEQAKTALPLYAILFVSSAFARRSTKPLLRNKKLSHLSVFLRSSTPTGSSPTSEWLFSILWLKSSIFHRKNSRVSSCLSLKLNLPNLMTSIF